MRSTPIHLWLPVLAILSGPCRQAPMFTNQALEYRGMDKIALAQRGSKVVVMAGDINEQVGFGYNLNSSMPA